MRYISTRSSSKECSFSEVVLAGLASDGGLYVPKTFPELTIEMLTSYTSLSYADLAFEVMTPFIGESIPSDDLRDMLHKTYTKQVFGTEIIAPVERLFDDVYLQDLSSGPSLAFKDMAMQFLGHLLDYELMRRDETLCILGASSGDTVSAAEEALRGKEAIDVVMLTPKDGMSPFQKAQAGSVLDDNIFNVSLSGPFDTCQDIVKDINGDLAFKSMHHIGAVNSINWGRILAQMVYYVSAYCQVINTVGDPLDVVVPTGNFGNILAAYYVKKMGVPLRRLIVATNENNVLDRFFKTGVYHIQDVEMTSSPSMDISKASNLERLLFDVVSGNSDELSSLMATFQQTGRVDLSAYVSLFADMGFYSGMSSHKERRDIIKKTYDQAGRVIDPHTAAGIKVAIEYDQHDGIPMVCMETAKPTKFESTVYEALGFIPDRPSAFIGLEDMPQRFYECEGTAESVKSFIASRKNIEA